MLLLFTTIQIYNSSSLRGSSSRTALLGVAVGKQHALVGQAVDIGRPISHHAVAVATEVRVSNVISLDDQDVRFIVCHFKSP